MCVTWIVDRERVPLEWKQREKENEQTHGKLILHLTHKLTFNKCQCLIIWERQFQMDVRATCHSVPKERRHFEWIYMALTTTTTTTNGWHAKCSCVHIGPFSPLKNDFAVIKLMLVTFGFISNGENGSHRKLMNLRCGREWGIFHWFWTDKAMKIEKKNE